MSTENDVPLGEGSRRYYEQQFGDRIHQIKKAGGSAPQPSGGGSNWSGRAGCGGIFVVFFIIRLILLFVRTQSDTPSYNYSPPQHHQFDFGEQKRLEDLVLKDKDNDELPRLEDILGPHLDKQDPDVGKPNDDKFAGPERLLTEADVPLLEGLCYRMDQESRQPGPTPGKRLCTPLPPPDQQRLIKASRGELRRDDEQRQLLRALDLVLHDAALYDGPSFEKVPGVADWVLLNGMIGNPAKGTPRFNRLLLEKCYPEQIVPLNQRDLINPLGRTLWKRRAKLDLDKARQKYEPKKH